VGSVFCRLRLADTLLPIPGLLNAKGLGAHHVQREREKDEERAETKVPQRGTGYIFVFTAN